LQDPIQLKSSKFYQLFLESLLNSLNFIFQALQSETQILSFVSLKS